nr:PREDICTED: uncharacterized protein LOC107078504 isoform X2 [Lepisosteus oculatus]XP_015211711.1 PREDICTED: uncharacterized protein LOC107078504 isoform X2 [Lepisosteus oculatus]
MLRPGRRRRGRSRTARGGAESRSPGAGGESAAAPQRQDQAKLPAAQGQAEAPVSGGRRWPNRGSVSRYRPWTLVRSAQDPGTHSPAGLRTDRQAGALSSVTKTTHPQLTASPEIFTPRRWRCLLGTTVDRNCSNVEAGHTQINRSLFPRFLLQAVIYCLYEGTAKAGHPATQISTAMSHYLREQSDVSLSEPAASTLTPSSSNTSLCATSPSWLVT